MLLLNVGICGVLLGSVCWGKYMWCLVSVSMSLVFFSFVLDVDPGPLLRSLGGKIGFGQARRQADGFSPGGSNGALDWDPWHSLV